MTFVDGRAYPMFAFLLGYGIVQWRRHTSMGVDEVAVCTLVRRRGAWMILFGFLPALLLFSGDIIGAYGLLAVLTMEVSVVLLVPAVALGVWAARRRMLDEPRRYRPLLRWVAVLAAYGGGLGDRVSLPATAALATSPTPGLPDRVLETDCTNWAWN